MCAWANQPTPAHHHHPPPQAGELAALGLNTERTLTIQAKCPTVVCSSRWIGGKTLMLQRTHVFMDKTTALTCAMIVGCRYVIQAADFEESFSDRPGAYRRLQEAMKQSALRHYHDKVVLERTLKVQAKRIFQDLSSHVRRFSGRSKSTGWNGRQLDERTRISAGIGAHSCSMCIAKHATCIQVACRI